MRRPNDAALPESNWLDVAYDTANGAYVSVGSMTRAEFKFESRQDN